jgi:hypothetical protein
VEEMIVDKSKPMNNYFTAYLDVHGIKDGDEVFAPDYFSWITDKHTAFREIKKCGYYNGFPPDVQKEFEVFIREVQP